MNSNQLIFNGKQRYIDYEVIQNFKNKLLAMRQATYPSEEALALEEKKTHFKAPLNEPKPKTTWPGSEGIVEGVTNEAIDERIKRREQELEIAKAKENAESIRQAESKLKEEQAKKKASEEKAAADAKAYREKYPMQAIPDTIVKNVQDRTKEIEGLVEKASPTINNVSSAVTKFVFEKDQPVQKAVAEAAKIVNATFSKDVSKQWKFPKLF